MLLNDHIYLRWALTGTAFLLVLPLLFKYWWKTDRECENDQSLVWAFTLTWTLVLNLYLGIYDTTLVVLSVLLTTNVFYKRVGNHQFELAPAYKFILLILYLVPWFTQHIARLTGLQIYTVVIALLGSYQFSQLGKGGSIAVVEAVEIERFDKIETD